MKENNINKLDKYTWPCYLLILQHKKNKMLYAHVSKRPKDYLQGLIRRSAYWYNDQYKIVRALHYCGIKEFKCGFKKFDSYEEALAARTDLLKTKPNYETLKNKPCGFGDYYFLLRRKTIVKCGANIEQRHDNLKAAIYSCYKQGLLSFDGSDDLVMRWYLEELMECGAIEGIEFILEEVDL